MYDGSLHARGRMSSLFQGAGMREIVTVAGAVTKYAPAHIDGEIQLLHAAVGFAGSTSSPNVASVKGRPDGKALPVAYASPSVDSRPRSFTTAYATPMFPVAGGEPICANGMRTSMM